MTIDQHKRLRGGFFAIQDLYQYLCRDFTGPIACAAAVLRAYVFTAQSREAEITLSAYELGELLRWTWEERTISVARAYLVSAGLLSDRTGKRGLTSRVQINFDTLDELERSIPSDWEAQLSERVRPKRYRSRPLHQCRATHAPAQTCTPRTSALEQSPSLSIDLAPKNLASSSTNESRQAVEAAFRDVRIQGVKANEQTLRNLTNAASKIPIEQRDAALRQCRQGLRNADTWGLVVHSLKHFTAQETLPLEEAPPPAVAQPQPETPRKPPTMEESDEANVWGTIKTRLAGLLSPAAYCNWIFRTKLDSFTDGALAVSVPDEVTGRWIEQEYESQIQAAIKALAVPVQSVSFVPRAQQYALAG